MLELLYKVEGDLAKIINRNIANIKTMYIDYHKPYVKRVWFYDSQLDCRIFLHEIEQCEESSDALYHPHKWDSAIRIIKGEYEMGIGHSETNDIPKTDCKIILSEGSCYEMTEKDGWHYVAPKTENVITLMVIPNKLNGRKMPIEPNKDFRNLTKYEAVDIIYKVCSQEGNYTLDYVDVVELVDEIKDLK